MNKHNHYGFASDAQRQLLDYWESLCRDRKMPTRRDLHPNQITKILPGICMYDVVRERKSGSTYLNFKARLVGTNVVNAVGKDFTGSFTGETKCQSKFDQSKIGLSGAECIMARVVRRRTPEYDTRFLDWPEKKHRRFSYIAMPLSMDEKGERVDIILLGVHFYSYDEEITLSRNHLLPCQA